MTVASTAAGQTALDAKTLEVMTARYSDTEEPSPAQAASALEALAASTQALAIGPGIPTGPGMRALVRDLAAAAGAADGRRRRWPERPGDRRGGGLVGRARRARPDAASGGNGTAGGSLIADVQADRVGRARALAAASRAVVVLKGARTVIAAPDGRVFINPAACSALATAGSGDVLCGLVGAMLARRADPLVAAQVAVYAHGVAGQQLAGELGDGTMAGDLPDEIARVLLRLRGRD